MPKILIADDEPEILHLCTFTFEREGFEVVTADSGPGALAMLEREKPDALVLDVMLPGMDGHTLGLKLSKDPVLSNIPVVVITALPVTRDLFSKFPQVKSMLTKPFDASVLVQAVKDALKHHPKK